MNKDEKWVDKQLYVEFDINLSDTDSQGKVPFKLCYGLNIWTVTDHLNGTNHV